MLLVYCRLQNCKQFLSCKNMETEQTILSMLKSFNKLVGCRQVLRGLSEGTIRCVVVSEDADDGIKDVLVKAATLKNAQILYAPSMEWLGRSVGIDVGAATVGFLKSEE